MHSWLCFWSTKNQIFLGCLRYKHRRHPNTFRLLEACEVSCKPVLAQTIDSIWLCPKMMDDLPSKQQEKPSWKTMINHLFLSFSHHFVGFPMVFPWVMGYFSMVFPADHLVPGGSCCASRSLARSSRRWDWWCWRALGSGTEGAKDPLVLSRKCESIWMYIIWMCVYIYNYIYCIYIYIGIVWLRAPNESRPFHSSWTRTLSGGRVKRAQLLWNVHNFLQTWTTSMDSMTSSQTLQRALNQPIPIYIYIHL